MSKITNAFEDDDIMFMGKYKGQRIGDLKSEYLLWMWDEFLHQHEIDIPLTDRERLAAYIIQGIDDLQKEAKDYILQVRPKFLSR